MDWKSLFVKGKTDEKDEEDLVESPRPQPKEVAKVVTFGAVPSGGTVRKQYNPSSTSIEPSSNHTTNDYNQTFLEVIQGAAVSSPGYKEFFNALRKLENRPFTEQQKFENVFIGLDAVGVTTQKLVETAQQIKGMIDGQRSHFNKEMEEFQEKEIDSKNQESERLKKEIEELQNRINENVQKSSELEREAFAAKQQLDLEVAAFESSLNAYSGMIENHITKINTYLNNGTTTTVQQ